MAIIIGVMIIAVGAFGRMDLLSESALICTTARNMGFVPKGRSAVRMNEL